MPESQALLADDFPYPPQLGKLAGNRREVIMAHTSVSTPLGVIEGFFGRPWSWSARESYASFMAQHGYDFYIYAPKSDAILRRRWQEDWTAAQWSQLLQLRSRYQQAGVKFGVGLSPYELYRQPSADSRVALTRKIESLNRLEPDILCLLFDDMRGDLPELAQRQVELVQTAANTTSASRIVFCPTYYSFDPILEKVFGARPADYWKTLAQGLDSAIDIFWTGPKVCSEHYPEAHLEQVNSLLGRRPFLWDNYPVNDSQKLCQQLRLQAFSKDRAHLEGHLAGHAVNPMNQPYLSQIPLSTLPQAYREGDGYQTEAAFIQACQRLCEPALAERLIEDRPLLQDTGLDALTESQRLHLKNRYQPFADSSVSAQELLNWLSGHYAFDPACLTE
ncbi:beta-N-acetylglucosaminidase domain-containing protein [Marinimicrobium sp. ABcell2]|uniref:beta-N-acetylglucosaminidase domain-containing protein n=1 Tax=Marinimicrobium sp. ABcell2 TaxID=3069751 RepID=UPI0027B3F359|nr:beta-N-acetylglucosaminidase domain-containing protein [Marinimicrobium sp. ABcell2]MDQ2077180.1 beta-N-acetylglucosaminidase domain-containing protein [Marinimicrobium sp. ABcell2]